MTGKKRITRRGDYEYHHHIDFVAWLRSKNILHFHPVNGVYVEAAWRREQLKLQGLSPGVPDIIIPVPNRVRWVDDGSCYHGLAIEIKRVSGGVVSPAQKEWIEKLRESGWKADVCRGVDEAIKVSCEYFEIDP